jgi:isopropylmalate/homocitrate/citramalate synthase
MIAKRIIRNIQGCPIRTGILSRISPQLFDVSLRDGIQNADPSKWTSDAKIDTFRDIVSLETPAFMEVGSMVSPKILPIMGDSIQIHDYTTIFLKGRKNAQEKNIGLYINISQITFFLVVFVIYSKFYFT